MRIKIKNSLTRPYWSINVHHLYAYRINDVCFTITEYRFRRLSASKQRLAPTIHQVQKAGLPFQLLRRQGVSVKYRQAACW